LAQCDSLKINSELIANHCKRTANIYGFPNEKSQFPRDRDVEGGQIGCQVHIPQSSLEIHLCALCQEDQFVFDI